MMKLRAALILMINIIAIAILYKASLPQTHSSSVDVHRTLLFEPIASGSFGDGMSISKSTVNRIVHWLLDMTVYKVTRHDENKQIQSVFATKFIQQKKVNGKMDEIEKEISMHKLAYDMDDLTRRHMVQIYSIKNESMDFNKEPSFQIDLEYVNGPELKDFYGSKREQYDDIHARFTPKEQLCSLLQQMGHILSKLNEQHIIFGDFKHRNVMLDAEMTRESGMFCLKLIDFGNADHLSEIVRMRGTPNTMSAVQYHLNYGDEMDRNMTLQMIQRYKLQNVMDLVSLIITGIDIWFLEQGMIYVDEQREYFDYIYDSDKSQHKPVAWALDYCKEHVLMLMYQMGDVSVARFFEKYWPDWCDLDSEFICYEKFAHDYIWNFFLDDVHQMCHVLD